MSAEYSLEAILNVANVCGGTVGKMLTAYAERVRADEEAVPVAHITRFIDSYGMDSTTIGMDLAAYKLPYGNYVLFTHPARSGVVSDEDVRDAERYRWLRVQGFDVPADIWVTTVKGYIPIVHSDLDEAIDAAIQGERHER